MSAQSPDAPYPGRRFSVGDWTVEPLPNQLERDGEEHRLEPKVMDVLCLLASKKGETVTKQEFLDVVWADTVVTPDVLSRCISELRKTLGDDSRNPTYIETIRKTGYRLIAPVETLETAPEEESEPNVESDSDNVDSGRGDAGNLDSADTESGAIAPASEDDGNGEDASIRPPISGSASILTSPQFWVVLLLIVGASGVIAWRLFLTVPPTGPPPQPTPLTSFPGQELYPALSSDGERTVFSWKRNGEPTALFLRQTGAETPLQLTNGPRDWSPAWSPNRRFLAFARDSEGRNGVFVVPSIGGSARQIADLGVRDIDRVTWSPDTSSNHLVISAQIGPFRPYALFLAPLDRDTLIQLTDPPSQSLGDRHPAISPDGRRVAFTRSLSTQTQDAHVLSIADTSTMRITEDGSVITGLAWLTGDELVMASRRGGVSALWRLPTNGDDPSWLTDAGEGVDILHPSIARDISRIAYARQTLHTNIWSLRGTSAEPFVSSTQWDSHPDISPDGEHVAFVSQRSGSPQVWAVARTGEGPAQLTSMRSTAVSTPRWSPSGEQICFVARENGRPSLFVVDADGGPVTRLTSSDTVDRMPHWSRDGAFIYFSSSRGDAWSIWRIRVADGTVRRVTAFPGLAAQEHPDGSSLLVVRPDTLGIWRYPLPETASDTLATQASPAAPLIDTSTTADQVVPNFSPREYANWRVTDVGVVALDRETDGVTVYRYPPGGERGIPVHTLAHVPEHPALAVSSNARWILLARHDERESDIVYLDVTTED